ncbi:hypothetical protein GXB85_05325 [Cellulomonas sp. APG4]|uniref:hypothetical protein n=1 Tax=Cellulomonas sp. APG4 TaxID=1538656 RepID=UPI00137942FF|nr:hypothetical protein [Cellulomonas sp. APG4]NCT90372.1 hypothetical protein [Cellulomonas sp. APG4]
MDTDEPGYVYEDAPGKRLFPLGNVYITRSIAESGIPHEVIAEFLAHHQHGLWGDDISDEDSIANNCATHGGGGRVLSAFRWTDPRGDEYRVHVVTEVEVDERTRHTTTVRLSLGR